MRPSSLLLLLSAMAIACGYSATTSPPPPPPQGNVVDAIGATAWNPSTITIKAGDAVDFRNSTGITHNVQFDAMSGRPDNVGNFASATRSVTFTTPGTYTFHCGIHPVMQGTVVVEP
jgi:plastocyanin